MSSATNSEEQPVSFLFLGRKLRLTPSDTAAGHDQVWVAAGVRVIKQNWNLRWVAEYDAEYLSVTGNGVSRRAAQEDLKRNLRRILKDLSMLGL